MSGGTFDYKQMAILEIVEAIEGQLANSDFEPVPMIRAHMRNALFFLRLAHVYANRLDWYLAGDDGEESFLERLAEELANVSP